MSGGVTTGGAGITTGRSGIFTGRAGVNIIGSDSAPWVAPDTMRVVIIGASIMNGVINNGGLASVLSTAYPDTTWTILDWATGGWSVDQIKSNALTQVQTISPSDPFDQTIFIIYSGGQIVSATRPHSGISQATRDEFQKVYDIRDAIVAEGFDEEDAHIQPLTFRPYSNDEAYLDETQGSAPYNTEFYLPYVESFISHADGTPFWDLYTFLFNNNLTLISSDGLHPTTPGYIAMAELFRDTIARYYMTGLAPTQLVQDSFSTIPAVPVGLQATEGDGQVTLIWSEQKVSRTYKIYRDGSLVQTVNHPTTEWTDTGLTNGTEYDYTISATNDGGESAQSSAVSVTPAAITTIILNASNTSSTTGINDHAEDDPAVATMNALVDTNGDATSVTGRIVAYGTGTRGNFNVGVTTGGNSSASIQNTNVLGNSMVAAVGPVTAEFAGLPANTEIEVQFVASRSGVSPRLIDVTANGASVITDYDVGLDPAVVETFTATTDGSGNLDIEASRGTGNTSFTYINGVQLQY